MAPDEISARFSGKGRKKDLPRILATLEKLAFVRQIQPGKYIAS